MEDQRRVVLENSSFLAFVPYAAEVPFEVWIMPKMHQASFSAISDRSKSDLSGVLQELLARLHGKLGDPDYNYVVYTSSRNNENEPQLHWFLQIRPRGLRLKRGLRSDPVSALIHPCPKRTLTFCDRRAHDATN
jgi:UDPglucose--hexose-1-phosphate uridylyltransferase